MRGLHYRLWTGSVKPILQHLQFCCFWTFFRAFLFFISMISHMMCFSIHCIVDCFAVKLSCFCFALDFLWINSCSNVQIHITLGSTRMLFDYLNWLLSRVCVISSRLCISRAGDHLSFGNIVSQLMVPIQRFFLSLPWPLASHCYGFQFRRARKLQPSYGI